MPKQNSLDNSYSESPPIQAGMKRYDVQAPDGRVITIEAADEATALRGAQEWSAANPAPSTLKQPAANQSAQPAFPGADGPILEINGRRVQVDKGFLTMTPEQQNDTVDEIAEQLGLLPSNGQASNVTAKSNALPQASLARTAGLAARSLGRGVVADALGMPADVREATDFLGTSGINLLTQMLNATAIPAAEKVLESTGVRTDIPDILAWNTAASAMR